MSNSTIVINGNGSYLPTDLDYISSTTTQIPLAECLYKFKFGDGLSTNIITLKENSTNASITFGSDFEFDCDYRKSFHVDIEIKSHTAENGKDFKGKR